MKAMPIAYKVCVEEDCPGALLTMKLPYVVNDVPIIVGNNNNEGHIQLSGKLTYFSLLCELLL